MIASNAVTAAASWRPQLFGDRRAATIPDPIIEPLWTGPRVLALIDGPTVRLVDSDGDAVDDQPEIVDALRDATGGATVLLEAFLSDEPIQEPAAIAGRETVTLPTPADAMTGMIFGRRGDRKDRLLKQQEEARKRTIGGSFEPLAFVAVDLLWIDDDPLFDVPLLERKRILESVLIESDLIRIGIHVKPPIDAWLGSWRAFGFRRLSYKGANSRYTPGEKNQDWATAAIPQR
jgi:hypothetical protein